MADPGTTGVTRNDRGLLTAAEWRHVLRRTWLGFVKHRGVDAAAALTYLSFLALFPIALSAVSALALLPGWQVLKWPLLLVVLVLMLGALYRWTPNVRRHRGPISWGPAIAILGWAVTSGAFALYVTRLGRFSVYGWMTGALVITLYLFLS